jgi:hypothetical protein
MGVGLMAILVCGSMAYRSGYSPRMSTTGSETCVTLSSFGGAARNRFTMSFIWGGFHRA